MSLQFLRGGRRAPTPLLVDAQCEARTSDAITDLA
jgi:hypothetical protein